MKKGQTITVYENPVTEEKIERKAKLIRQLAAPIFRGLEYWRIKFENGDLADRGVDEK